MSHPLQPNVEGDGAGSRGDDPMIDLDPASCERCGFDILFRHDSDTELCLECRPCSCADCRHERAWRLRVMRAAWQAFAGGERK